MERTRALVTGPLAGWTGRLLLLGAVVFWWGAVVVPNLISLAFPAWLPPESIPRDLNPDIDWEGRLANRVSAAALLALAVLALIAAEVSRRRAEGWVAVAGWTALAGTAAFLFWEETTDFHATELPGLARSVFSEDVLSQAGTFIWVLMAIPLIAGFLLAMAGFYFRGLHKRDVRRPFAFGLGAWAACPSMRRDDAGLDQRPGVWADGGSGGDAGVRRHPALGVECCCRLVTARCVGRRISRPPFRPVGCCVGGGCCCAGRAVRRVGISSSAGRCTSNGRARGLLGQPGGWAVGRAGVPHAGCSARRTESSPGQSGP